MGWEEKMKEEQGKRLAEERLRLGYLVQRQFATKLGMSPQSWSRYEKGKSFIQDDTLKRLKQLRFDTDYIIFNRKIGGGDESLNNLQEIERLKTIVHNKDTEIANLSQKLMRYQTILSEYQLKK